MTALASVQAKERRRQFEQVQINIENAKFATKLRTTKSNIPMNSKIREKEQRNLDNYKMFSSRHKGSLPTIDPLVKKRMDRD